MRAFFELTPQWIRFEQFWISLKRRNVWLIQLRYGAVVMLIFFIAAFEFFPRMRVDVVPLSLICLSIFIYNLIFHYFSKYIPETQAPFHGLHFALLQILTDFLALLMFVYYTGGIETPFQVFFLFHVIIGSLILPARIVTLIIIGTMLITGTGAVFELQGIIPHHRIEGLLAFPLYSNPLYLALHYTVFTIALLVSNYLANSISKELYMRERALSKAYQQLKDAEKQKSLYVMSVVHDLKTPIAAAITYLNMIMDGSLGEVPTTMEKPIKRSHIRLSNAITMIGDVLQLSQVKLSGDIEANSIDLRKLFDDIYADMRILFVSKNLTYDVIVEDKECTCTIEGEARLIKLAMANLISNARKYTEEGGKVIVSLGHHGDQITVRVSDTGIGIPQQELDKVFKDFYRTALSKKKGIEGTGLGMSIVSHIVKSHHGTVRVESPSGIGDEAHPGSSFILTFPKKFVKRETNEEQVMVDS